jgi:hypothetical protein
MSRKLSYYNGNKTRERFGRRHSARIIPTLSVLVLSTLLLIWAAPPVHASGSVVQQNSKHIPGGPGAVAFTSSVSYGHVIVVAIDTYTWTVPVSSVTDSFGSSYVAAVSLCNITADGCSAIYYATSCWSGSDTVTVKLTFPSTYFDVFIFEVSGITTPTASTGTGAGTGTAVATSSTSFTTEGFLIGTLETFRVDTLTAGSGFTASAEPSGDLFSLNEYSTSGVSSPTTFPATISQSDHWVEVGAAFNSGVASASCAVGVNLHLATYKIVNVQVKLLQGSTLLATRTVTLSYASPNAKVVFQSLLPGIYTVQVNGYSVRTQATTVQTTTINFVIS